jgi:cysteine synthase
MQKGTHGTAITISLLQSKQNFAVRALTRKPESEKAQRLSALGAEVVKADGFNDDEMKAALENAWGFWLNTHHHDPVCYVLYTTEFVAMFYAGL